MKSSYGVVWREGAKPLARGKLELLPRSLLLHGMTGSTPTTREIAYDSLADVHIGRSAKERIDGHPSLVVAPRSGDVFSIASVAQSGVVAEIAERLASLQHKAGQSHSLTIVLPLLPDARDAVVTLLEAGPPFDPDALHLDRHRVLLTDSEAIFFFESPLGADALVPLFHDPRTWERAAAWQELLAGPPRIAEDVFSWTRAGTIDRALLPPGLRNGDGDEAPS